MKTLKLISFFFLSVIILSACQKENITLDEAQALGDQSISQRSSARWLAFYKGTHSDKVYTAISQNGTSFTEFRSLDLNEETDRTPDATMLGNRLFTYYRGDNSHRIFLAYSDDRGNNWNGNWSASGALSNKKTGVGPAVVTFNGEIYLFIPSHSGGIFPATERVVTYYKSTDGFTFTGPFEPKTTPTPTNPQGYIHNTLDIEDLEMAPVVHQGRLYLCYVDDDEAIRVVSTATGNETDWSEQTGSYVGEHTQAGISATSIGSELALTFTGQSSRKVYVKRASSTNTLGGLNWKKAVHVGAYSNDRPGIAFGSATLTVLYKDGGGSNSNFVQGDYFSFPGSSWNPIPWSSSGPTYFGHTNKGVSLVYMP